MASAKIKKKVRFSLRQSFGKKAGLTINNYMAVKILCDMKYDESIKNLYEIETNHKNVRYIITHICKE